MDQDMICMPKTTLFLLLLILVFCGYSFVQYFKSQQQECQSQLQIKQQPVQYIIANTPSQQPVYQREPTTQGGYRKYVNSRQDNQQWQSVGYLYDSANVRYPLFSRYKYPGNNNSFEYYIQDDSRNRIQIPVTTAGYREINDNDQVTVESVGTLTALIYPIEQIKYNGYME